MPRAPKACNYPGCTTPTTTTRCPDHTTPGHNWTRYPSPRNTQLTDAEREAFRRAVLHAEPWCRNCGNTATEADHITPIAAGGTNDPDTNGQGLCHTCHAAKSKRERRRRPPTRTP